jgi:2-polyprenyl-3-methyl-5-hydroxy-6-metoxy-1,4-benzoquinol methylase
MLPPTPRFAAIIGHSDQPDILDSCIRHHLAIGLDYIFISLNKDSKATPDAFAGDPRVRAGYARSFARQDLFLYFSHAVQELVAWSAPDWVLFADSDEFWLPRSRTMSGLRDLSDTDLLIVDRFNAPVLHSGEHAFRASDLADPYNQLLIVAREDIAEDYLSGNSEIPWIMGVDAPKLMVRPELVERVGTGGHSILARDADLRWRLPDDLLILHAPFTDENRFRRKLEAVRRTFALHAGRFDSRQAWHWRYWLSLDEEGISAEFQRQSFVESSTSILQRRGVLAFPQVQYEALPQQSGQFTGDALQEMLGRVIQNYERPGIVAATAATTVMRPVEASPNTPERAVDDIAECHFYHSMDVPGVGEVLGRLDLRGGELAYLGGVDVQGAGVLEIGTASGHICFWMEAQGATVTAFDLDEHHHWDIVPVGGQVQDSMAVERAGAVQRMNNAWWLMHHQLQSTAHMIYGTVYAMAQVTETFDIVLLQGVLRHLRDPFQALSQAAARSHGQLIVTEISARHFLGLAPMTDETCMQFLPRLSKAGPNNVWWLLPEKLMEEFLRILGFRTVEITHHTQHHADDGDRLFYTAVATR